MTSCCVLLEVIILRMTITDKSYISLLACIVLCFFFFLHELKLDFLLHNNLRKYQSYVCSLMAITTIFGELRTWTVLPALVNLVLRFPWGGEGASERRRLGEGLPSLVGPIHGTRGEEEERKEK